MFLEADHGKGELFAEIESGGELALQRDQIPSECEVVADKNGEARAELPRILRVPVGEVATLPTGPMPGTPVSANLEPAKKPKSPHGPAAQMFPAPSRLAPKNCPIGNWDT